MTRVMPKILTWTLGVQHELYRNATIEVRYWARVDWSCRYSFRRNFHSYFDAAGTRCRRSLRRRTFRRHSRQARPRTSPSTHVFMPD